MQEIVKREDQELINVIRNAAIKLWGAENGPEVRACLDELERRHCNKGSVLARLARVEEDLAAFKRAHAEHRHTMQGASNVVTSVPCRAKASAEQITDLRTNSENRAWRCFEDWRALEVKKPENAGNVYHVQIKPPESAEDWDASIWFSRLVEVPNGTAEVSECTDLIVSKRGTSRLDALAHLASWCQAEMPETPRDRTCGTCNGRERDHDGADHAFNPDHKDNRPAIR